MKLLRKYLIDLSDWHTKDRLGHISYYKSSEGKEHHVFFIEERYFGSDVISGDGKVIFSDRALDDYDYKLDSYFYEESRRTPFGL